MIVIKKNFNSDNVKKFKFKFKQKEILYINKKRATVPTVTQKIHK